MCICFVALQLHPQTGQMYFRWWVLVAVVPMGFSPLLFPVCVPMLTETREGLALHISISRSSLWERRKSIKASAGSVWL